jgi:hypothetical protein
MMEKAQEVEDSKPDKLLFKSYKVTSCTKRTSRSPVFWAQEVSLHKLKGPNLIPA